MRPESHSLPPSETGKSRSLTRLAAGALVPLSVLLLGAAVSTYLLNSSPKAARKTPPRQARLVDVAPVHLVSQAAVVQVMGTVAPAREIVLRPRVGGEIVAVGPEFIPGGQLAAGETILRIDPSDYELTVKQRASDLAEAQAALALEIGNQDVAQREYEILGEAVAEDERGLVLRQPQLRTTRARVQRAEAALAAARLDLERTVIRSPFAAMVGTRAVDLGAQVDPGTELGTLIGTEEYWVEAFVPVSDLHWISIPSSPQQLGSIARIYHEAAWGKDVSRAGRVIRLQSDLESEGRMARLLVSVRDPLGTESAASPSPRLLLGSFVRVEIEGQALSAVAALDHELLRDGNRVWIMNADDHLEIRPVTVAFRNGDQVLITSGLEEGELVVTSEISAPVAGMPLRLAEPDNG